jgi:hypothetical protein
MRAARAWTTIPADWPYRPVPAPDRRAGHRRRVGPRLRSQPGGSGDVVPQAAHPAVTGGAGRGGKPLAEQEAVSGDGRTAGTSATSCRTGTGCSATAPSRLLPAKGPPGPRTMLRHGTSLASEGRARTPWTSAGPWSVDRCVRGCPTALASARRVRVALPGSPAPRASTGAPGLWRTRGRRQGGLAAGPSALRRAPTFRGPPAASGDVSSAPNASTRTQLGVSDRSVQRSIT